MKKDLDYEGTNRNMFPFFHETETSVSSFCLFCLNVHSKETVPELISWKLRVKILL